MTTHDEKNRPDLLVEERDLRAMLARRRPDAARFAAGVAERLERGGKDAGDDDDDGKGAAGGISRSRFGVRALLDRAASVLPGFPGGSSLGKWTTIVSLPLLLVVGALVAFVHGFREVDPARHRDGRPASARDRRISQSLQNRLVVILLLLALPVVPIVWFFGPTAIGDEIALSLILAMAVSAWFAGRLARAGVVDAMHVGRTMIGVLLALYAGLGNVFGHQLPGEAGALFGAGAVSGVLLTGIVACFLMLRRFCGQLEVKLRVVLVGVVLVACLGMPLPVFPVATLRHDLTSMHLDPDNWPDWVDAETIARALRVAGAVPPDLAPVRARLAAVVDSLAAAPEGGEDVHPQVWTTAIALGLLDGDQLRRIAHTPLVQQRIDAMLTGTQLQEHLITETYLLDCLLASHQLNTLQREQLAARIDASWSPPSPRQTLLDRALLCARWLDRLGRRDLVLARRDQLQAMLLQHWVGLAASSPFRPGGGFTSKLCLDPTQNLASVDATAKALELIRIVGAPAAVPLRDMDAYLASHAPSGLLMRVLLNDGKRFRQAVACRMLLRDGVGLPPRDLWQSFLADRAAFAALLLVLLALRAIWTAHRSEQALVGAQP